MARASMDNVKEYYRLITEIDIGLVARELLGARSRRSLHVTLDKQGWYCEGFAWGLGRGKNKFPGFFRRPLMHPRAPPSTIRCFADDLPDKFFIKRGNS